MLLKKLFPNRLEMVKALERHGYETTERLVVKGEVLGAVKDLLKMDTEEFRIFCQQVKKNISQGLLQEEAIQNRPLGCLGEKPSTINDSEV